MFISIDKTFSFSLFKTEELIIVVMCFHPDLFSRKERHQHELRVLAGVEHMAEIAVG